MPPSFCRTQRQLNWRFTSTGVISGYPHPQKCNHQNPWDRRCFPTKPCISMQLFCYTSTEPPGFLSELDDNELLRSPSWMQSIGRRRCSFRALARWRTPGFIHGETDMKLIKSPSPLCSGIVWLHLGIACACWTTALLSTPQRMKKSLLWGGSPRNFSSPSWFFGVRAVRVHWCISFYCKSCPSLSIVTLLPPPPSSVLALAKVILSIGALVPSHRQRDRSHRNTHQFEALQ